MTDNIDLNNIAREIEAQQLNSVKSSSNSESIAAETPNKIPYKPLRNYQIDDRQQQLNVKIAAIQKKLEEEKKEAITKLVEKEKKIAADSWQEKANKQLDETNTNKIVADKSTYNLMKFALIGFIVLIVIIALAIAFFGYGVIADKFGFTSIINNTINLPAISNNYTVNNNINVTQPTIIVNNTVNVRICNLNGSSTTC